jgi:hypothetical protein
MRLGAAIRGILLGDAGAHAGACGAHYSSAHLYTQNAAAELRQFMDEDKLDEETARSVRALLTAGTL